MAAVNVSNVVANHMGMYTVGRNDCQCTLCCCQVNSFMCQKEQEALAFIEVMVKHQRAVFTSNPRFAQTVTNAFEDIKAYRVSRQEHAVLLQHLANANLDTNLAPTEPAMPTWRVAWESHPELRVGNASHQIDS
jgi:predicted DCC family thiol-disulfide oxidoreductase YuxK